MNLISPNIFNNIINNSKDINEFSKRIIFQNDEPDEKIFLEHDTSDLNDLDYSETLKKDKRNFFLYYLSLLKSKHILFFSFCKNNDYNSRIIKNFLFFYSLGVYLFVNTLFFNDSTMHKIYIDIGVYNFAYQISQIVYSTLISIVLNLIIRTLALTEKSILRLKKVEKNIVNAKKKLIKILFFKFLFFFIISFCLLIFFWYYISSFCAIYSNTQIHLITDTIISFSLSMIYPLGIYLLSGVLRILALRAPYKDKKEMYLFCQVIQLL